MQCSSEAKNGAAGEGESQGSSGGMRQILGWATKILALLYAFAVLVFLIGTFGWLGAGKDPLSGVYLLPLGLPWIYLLSRSGLEGLAPPLLAPAINVLILFCLWRWSRHRPVRDAAVPS